MVLVHRMISIGHSSNPEDKGLVVTDIYEWDTARNPKLTRRKVKKWFKKWGAIKVKYEIYRRGDKV